MREGTLAEHFSRLHTEREESLMRVRLAARVSIPWLFPDEEYDTWHPDDLDLPENYQSLVARGCANMASNITFSTWPLTGSAFEYTPNVAVLENPNIPDDVKQEMLRRLHVRDVVIMSALEAGTKKHKQRYGTRSKFRSAKYHTYLQAIVTGDCLSRLNDDFRWSIYRREQYVTDRDDCGDVNLHIVREKKDLAFLDSKTLRDHYGLTRDQALAMGEQERQRDLFTLVRWEPDTKKWLVRQEIKATNDENGRVINEFDERVSSYISTAWSLSPGDNYGRGFVELNQGDAYSFDSISRSLKEFAAICSKMEWVIDEVSNVKDRDLLKPSGSVMRGRVSGGQAQDIAMLKVDKIADFGVVFQTHQALRKDLGHSMLIESEIQPQKERVTREQIISIRNELDKATIGASISVADSDVEGTIFAADAKLVRDRIIPPLPKDAVDMRILTGVTSLSKAIKSQSLEQFIQTAPLLGEQAMRYIDMGAVLQALARYKNIDEPGVIKTEDQIRKETADALRVQLAQAAGQQAIETAGAITEAGAEAALQPTGV